MDDIEASFFIEEVHLPSSQRERKQSGKMQTRRITVKEYDDLLDGLRPEAQCITEKILARELSQFTAAFRLTREDSFSCSLLEGVKRLILQERGRIDRGELDRVSEKIQDAILHVLPELRGVAGQKTKVKIELECGHTLSYWTETGEIQLTMPFGEGDTKRAHHFLRTTIEKMGVVREARIGVYSKAFVLPGTKRAVRESKQRISEYEDQLVLKSRVVKRLQKEILSLKGKIPKTSFVFWKLFRRIGDEGVERDKKIKSFERKRAENPLKFNLNTKRVKQLNLLMKESALEEAKSQFISDRQIEEVYSAYKKHKTAVRIRNEVLFEKRKKIAYEGALAVALTKIRAPFVAEYYQLCMKGKQEVGFTMKYCSEGNASVYIAKNQPTCSEVKQRLEIFRQMAIAVGFLHDPHKAQVLRKIDKGLSSVDDLEERELLQQISEGRRETQESSEDCTSIEALASLLSLPLCNTDLKPENFFLEPNGVGGVRVAMGDLAATIPQGSLLGESTLIYDSDERRGAASVYTPGDCAALGFMLYEFIYGSREESRWEVYKEKEIKQIVSFGNPVNDLILGLTAVNPDERISSYDAARMAEKALEWVRSCPDESAKELSWKLLSRPDHA